MTSSHQLTHNSSLAALRVDEMGATSNTVVEKFPLKAEKIGDFQQTSSTHLSKQSPGRRKGPSTFDMLRSLDIMKWLCAALHLALIAVLVYLLARPGQTHYEGAIIFPQTIIRTDDDLDVDASEALKQLAKTGMGWIITAVVILLTFTTQRLALRRQLHLDNTLTAKHDANSAWMGVGAAAMTLLSWRDIGPKAALSSTVFPFLYLGSLAVLHSVTTSMVTLVLYSTNETRYFLSNGLPNFTGPSLDNAFTGSSALLTILSLDDFVFTGLGNDGLGMMYDIPTDRRFLSRLPIETVNVNATYFNVTCGMLGGTIAEVSNGNYNLTINNDPRLSLAIPAPFSQNALAIRSSPWQFVDNNSDLSYWPSAIVVLSTVPILDSLNRDAQTISVEPTMNYTSFDPNGRGATQETTEIRALGCNLTIQYLPEAVIDSATAALINSTATNKTSAIWTEFPSEFRQTLLDFSDPQDALTFVWGSEPEVSISPLLASLPNACSGSNNSSCQPLYEAEQFVMESLNIFPDILLGQQNSASNIALVDLENVLSRMSAIEIWAEAQGNNLKFANILNLEGLEDSANTEKSLIVNNNRIDYTQNYLVLGISRSYLCAALALSIFLLILATPSILDDNNLTKIDSFGLLQIVYLINRWHPELHQQWQQIVKDQDPSVAALRKEGNKQPVRFGEETRKRRGGSKWCTLLDV